MLPLTLADIIEAYLLRLVDNADSAELAVSRRQLADRFRCAPSQINYVLETRFTPERGFVIRSRRGGGGHILIVQVNFTSQSDMFTHIYRQAARGLTPTQAVHLVRFLESRGVTTSREARLMEAALDSRYAGLPDEDDRALRGRLMQAMLSGLMT
ncbi:MAG: CtsR family transcriptional regulator [Bacillota bacterium]|nr:MAG: CtsR family transcriptional regulator [Bacillota bacterium]